MSTCPACDDDFDHCAFQYAAGQKVIWSQQRKWGGTQNEPATFLRYSGKQSARILHGDKERTVTLARLKPDTSGTMCEFSPFKR